MLGLTVNKLSTPITYHRYTLAQMTAGLAGSLALHYPFQHQTVISNNLVVINTLFFLPFPVVRKMRLDQIGVRVVTGVALGKARVGIYSSNSNNLPSTLLVDSGELDVSTSGTTVMASIDITLDVGLYWSCLTFDSAVTIQGGITQHSNYVLGLSPTSNLAGWRCNSVAFAPLPSPPPAISANINASADVHGMLFRISEYK